MNGMHGKAFFLATLGGIVGFATVLTIRLLTKATTTRNQVDDDDQEITPKETLQLSHLLAFMRQHLPNAMLDKMHEGFSEEQGREGGGGEGEGVPKERDLGSLAKLLALCNNSYNASYRPKRIILIRHGESLGNIDETAYGRIPDNRMPLTKTGITQAKMAGHKLRSMIGDESLRVYNSPYIRTQQTMDALLSSGFPERRESIRCVESVRLREQEFGNFQNKEEMENYKKQRSKFGRFWYRFPNGESGADVYNRVDAFYASLQRSLDANNVDNVENVLIITHGLTMRLFCMKYLKWTVEFFEQVWNPGNCEMWVLEKTPSGRYSLVSPIKVTEGVTVGKNLRRPPARQREIRSRSYLSCSADAIKCALPNSPKKMNLQRTQSTPTQHHTVQPRAVQPRATSLATIQSMTIQSMTAEPRAVTEEENGLLEFPRRDSVDATFKTYVSPQEPYDDSESD